MNRQNYAALIEYLIFALKIMHRIFEAFTYVYSFLSRWPQCRISVLHGVTC